MKLSDNVAVQRVHFPNRDSFDVIDKAPIRRFKKANAMRVKTGICRECLQEVHAVPATSADRRWFAMRDVAVRCGTQRHARSTASPSRLWRQNYYLSALEAAGVLSYGRRALAWHLIDIARQLGERRPPHPSTVQRWRRQIVLSRTEAYAHWAYFDQMQESHTARRRPQEMT